MDSFIPVNFNNILKKEIKKFKSHLLNTDYEAFMTYDYDDIFSLFIYSILENKKGLKIIKEKCLKNNISEKEFNKFIYKSYKFRDKQERGIWSFHEITELNIPFENIKKLTLTYTIM